MTEITTSAPNLDVNNPPAIPNPIPQAKRRWRIQGRWTWFVFIVPALIFYTVFMAIPLFNSLRLSFYTGVGLIPDHFVGLDNYIKLFTDEFWSSHFRNALGNTI